jgi:N-acyl-D-amino-acid deacylase
MSEPIEAFDLLIEGGTVIDGTGAPRFDANVVLLAQPDMDFKVSLGVTTVVTGNCGIGPAPLEPDTPMPAPSAYPPAPTTRRPRRPAPSTS